MSRFGRLVLVATVLAGLLFAGCSSPHGAGSPVTVTSAMRPSPAQVAGCATDHAASWMGCLVSAHPAFATAPISGLAIPGSNNAGTFNLDLQAFDVQPGSRCAVAAAQHLDLGSVVQQWSQTQDETITQQLDAGVRWVDLQVGFNGTDAVTGWRVVQNLYSDYPLSVYLGQIATWASTHRSEAVVVDLRTICYDHDPTTADQAGLWANFATPSTLGTGTTTVKEVAFNASSLGTGSLATATLADITGQGGGGHNVVVLVPAGSPGLSVLTQRFGVHPVATVGVSGIGHTSGTTVVLDRPGAGVAPTSVAGFEAANHTLEQQPLASNPALGSLVGKGLTVVPLIYDLGSATAPEQKTLVATFGGLLNPSSPPGAAPGSAPLSAWESGLWTGIYPGIRCSRHGATGRTSCSRTASSRRVSSLR